MNRITKRALIRRVHALANDEYEFSKRHVELVVDDLLDTISGALSAGQTVTITGFGTFTPKDRAARQARNPRTGELTQVPANRSVAFRPAKTLKARLNGGG